MMSKAVRQVCVGHMLRNGAAAQDGCISFDGAARPKPPLWPAAKCFIRDKSCERSKSVVACW